MSQDRRLWPMWVRFGLWKVPLMSAARLYMGFSLLLAAGSATYGFREARFFVVAFLLCLAACWYWLAARWVEGRQAW